MARRYLGLGVRTTEKLSLFLETVKNTHEESPCGGLPMNQPKDRKEISRSEF